jgi:hypothetical protein
MRSGLLLAALLICFGCSPKPNDTTKTSGAAASGSSSPALSLDGPGGSVAIGDDAQQAMDAFPAPEDAEVFNESMSFTVLSVQGWAWGLGEGTGFEAAFQDGKVVALALTELDGPPEADAVEKAKAMFGGPTRMAESDNLAVLVWEAGQNARYHVVYKKEIPQLGVGEITVIGPIEKLKLLGYIADDPESFVRQTDAAVDIHKSIRP